MWRHYEGQLTCSECGAVFYDDIMEYCGDDVPKFCPDCGADMRKKHGGDEVDENVDCGMVTNFRLLGDL